MLTSKENTGARLSECYKNGIGLPCPSFLAVTVFYDKLKNFASLPSPLFIHFPCPFIALFFISVSTMRYLVSHKHSHLNYPTLPSLFFIFYEHLMHGRILNTVHQLFILFFIFLACPSIFG
eukprot:TRINITY_DN154_c2_g1_i1.p1 TRINITY_DN154_c2_g1~~TRINITY_DN154_c2_g1_i1.p1  ORF type:complete len:121 (+),score=4.87 TRINITY_DN154_c2_g1_i1:155-517(+)